jgi:hypothetical protein
MIAIAAPTDDMEIKIDLGSGERGERRAGWRYAQPPRSVGDAGTDGDGDEAGEIGASP